MNVMGHQWLHHCGCSKFQWNRIECYRWQRWSIENQWESYIPTSSFDRMLPKINQNHTCFAWSVSKERTRQCAMAHQLQGAQPLCNQCEPATMSCSQADVNAVTSSKSTALWHAVGSSAPYGPFEMGVSLVMFRSTITMCTLVCRC